MADLARNYSVVEGLQCDQKGEQGNMMERIWNSNRIRPLKTWNFVQSLFAMVYTPYLGSISYKMTCSDMEKRGRGNYATSNPQASVLRVSRHVDLGLGCNGVLARPKARHSLGLSVEVETWLSIKGGAASPSDTTLVTRKGEHGKRDGNWTAGLSVGAPIFGSRDWTYTLIPTCPASMSRWKRAAVAPD